MAHSRIKQALNHHKINNGRNCQYYKFLVIDLGLTDRNLSCTRPKSAFGKSSRCRFLFSVARNVITKVTEYFNFGFSFRILVCKRQESFSVIAEVFLSRPSKQISFFSVYSIIITSGRNGCTIQLFGMRVFR